MNRISQNNNNKNDDEYVYDIDFEKYVDNIVNSDDENDKNSKLNIIIITEKEFYDKDHIHNSYPNNNTRIIYNKGSIYTNQNNLNRNYSNRNYVNRNYSNRNNNVDTIVKKVSFNDNIKIIDDSNTNTFREDSPKSVVNFKECNDDVRNKKINDFIPKGKYVFNKNNSNY
jgi:hypothetical protein